MTYGFTEEFATGCQTRDTSDVKVYMTYGFVEDPLEVTAHLFINADALLCRNEHIVYNLFVCMSSRKFARITL